GLFGGRVDHGQFVFAHRCGDHVLAVRCGVDVVRALAYRYTLHLLERRRIHDIDPRLLTDTDVHAPAVLPDGEVVRPLADRNAPDDPPRGALHYVQHILGFVGHIETAAIGRGDDAVRIVRDSNRSDCLILLRVDNRDVITSAVGNVNTNSGRGER